ncbi:MAG TPA: DapH/DapD/GlmU-related protein [Phycisphaerae bacterium]|nr:DapH/DapD/GlmU-related protein [Phycisphaerae bacterium]
MKQQQTSWFGGEAVWTPTCRAGHAGKSAPVWIGDDVWLGLSVVVLKGVTIGARTVVAAGSIVTRSLPPGVVAAGTPPRVVGQVSQPSECIVEVEG